MACQRGEMQMKNRFLWILAVMALLGCGGSPGSAEQRVVAAQLPADQREPQRKLAMDGMENFRDLGGYRTRDGRTVKWGVIYRSDSLADASDEDLYFMGRLGLKQVVDFRTEFEKTQDPDRLPSGVRYIERAIDIEGTATKELFAKITRGDIDDLDPRGLMERANRAFVSAQRGVYSAYLRSLLSPDNLPVVAHCTGGKDRAGFAAAITLLALGVPEETVIEDYLLTNEYTRSRIERYVWAIRLGSFFRTDPEPIRPLLGVDRSFIEAAIEQMKLEFGSIENYFRDGLGITDAEISQLRERLLEG